SRHGRVLHEFWAPFIREDNGGSDVVDKVFKAEDTTRRTYSCTTNNAFDHTVVAGGSSPSNAKTTAEAEDVKFPWSANPGHSNVVHRRRGRRVNKKRSTKRSSTSRPSSTTPHTRAIPEAGDLAGNTHQFLHLQLKETS
ncbi:unnamed protein product, partial [Brassica rapa subsp. narinosa]